MIIANVLARTAQRAIASCAKRFNHITKPRALTFSAFCFAVRLIIAGKPAEYWRMN